MTITQEAEMIEIGNKNPSNSQVDSLPERDLGANWNLGQVGRDFGYRHQVLMPDQLSTMDVESGYISNRRKRAISVGSGVTNLAFDRNEADHVTQLGNNHYMIRRRGTKIHIKGFPSIKSPNESLPGINEDDLEESEQEEDKGSISTLLSGLYALHLFLFTMALKIAKVVTENVTMRMFDYYLIALYSISLIWMILYHPLASSCYREQERIGYEKSSHSTNRYLKGVVAVFGLAIIIKDGLEFLAYLGIDNPHCTDKELYAALPIIHIIFILSQINYLFRYSKVFIQDFQVLSRFGLMHVVATDLTVWISTIIDETSAALTYHDDHDSNSSNYYSTDNHGKAGNIHTEILFSENCTCNDSFCTTISIAEAFLYPFVIEFSLVACCLLYVTWRNVGKASHACQQIIRPSYRLYKSYIGVMVGSFMLFAMIIVMIVLATINSGIELEHRNFFTEYRYLNIHNTFIIVVGFLITLACLFGFYLFHKTTHDIDKNGGENLDNVLLLICLSGPSLLSLFSIIAFSANDHIESSYVPSLVMQVVDTISCIAQVIFIMYGLKLKPITSEESQETVSEVKQTISTSDPLDLGSEYEGDVSGDEEDVYCGRSRTTSIASLAKKVRYPNLRPAFNFNPNNNQTRKFSNIAELSEAHDNQNNIKSSFISEGFDIATTATSFIDIESRQTEQTQMDSVFEDESDTSPEEKKNGTKSEAGDGTVPVSSDLANTSRSMTPVDTDSNEKQSPQTDQNDSPASYNDPAYTSHLRQQQRLRKNDILRKKALVNSLNQSPLHAVKIISETKVADPDKIRLLLRNVLMFLLIANACLWLYWSLNGTAFTLYEYQDLYYPNNVWIIITMFCRPFIIFFRMHSAACLFEIWSFA